VERYVKGGTHECTSSPDPKPSRAESPAIFQLKEEFAMMMATGTKNVKVWISENLRTRLGAKVFLGLALGALLLAGTTMYFSISQGVAGSPTASGMTTQSFQSPADAGPGDLSESSFRNREEQRVADSLLERLELQRILKDKEDYTKASSPSYEQQRAADSLEERLEVQRVLQEVSTIGTAEGIHVLPEDDPYAYLTPKEFAGVTGHGKVDGMETGILPGDDAYAYSDLSEFASVIERLERQIDSMLAEAARDPSKNSPLFNREIQRLDDQIDMIRLNAMKNAPPGRPLSGDQGQVRPDRSFPDTEYYLDPDWREPEAAEE
jgi:hypothetical protein